MLEPTNGEVLTKDQLDLIVVPGVAFTASGKRLGFGGGYYDRYLADYAGQTIAVALTTQVAEEDEWDGEAHDVQLNQVVRLVD